MADDDENNVSLVLSLPEPLARALRDGLKSQGMEELADELSRQLKPGGGKVEPTGMGAVVKTHEDGSVWVRCDTDTIPWRCVTAGGLFGEWRAWHEFNDVTILGWGVDVTP